MTVHYINLELRLRYWSGAAKVLFSDFSVCVAEHDQYLTCCGFVQFQLTYHSMEWKGQIAIAAEPENLAVAVFETVKDGDKLTMVNIINVYVCMSCAL